MMTATNVFRLRGYRGGHRQYWYLTPVVDNAGNLLPEQKRARYQDCNEWQEPFGLFHQLKQCSGCEICARPSVFATYGPWTRDRYGADEWREDFEERNCGSYYQIWDEDGSQVLITPDEKYIRGGVLSRVRKVELSELGRHSATLDKTFL